MKKEDIKLWARRALVYCAGLFIMALGVVFSVKSALGVSPVTCLANVTSNITGLGLGLCTTGTYCLYIAVELLILRRDFKAEMLLQIAASFFFGLLVTLATKLLAFIPAPQTYSCAWFSCCAACRLSRSASCFISRRRYCRRRERDCRLRCQKRRGCRLQRAR